MLKKLLTSWILLTFILSNWLQAFEPFSRKWNIAWFEPFSRKPVDITQEFTPIDWDIQVNYQDITAQNAGKVLNKWTWKENFKSRIILTWGVYLELDKDKLDLASNSIVNLQNKIKEMEVKKLNSWKIEIAPVEMIQYPDRITVRQNYKMIFENKKEFDNFQKYVWTWSDIKKKVTTAMLQKQRDWIDKLIKECKSEWYCKTKAEEDSMKIKVVQGLLDWKKIFDISDEVSYNLIPLDITKLNEVENPNFNLKLEPSQVRINIKDINARFEKIKILNESKVNIKNIELNSSWIDLDKIQVKNASAGASSTSSRMSPEDFCSVYFMPNEDWYARCIRDKTILDTKTILEADKLMLNWFTIWNSWSDGFNVTLSIPKVRKPWENTTIFRARSNWSFSYGVWLRVPFLTQVQVDDKYISEDNLRVQYKAKIDTLDISANQYSQLWLPSEHLFDWKEFVLEVKASVFAKVVLFWEDLINETWGLGSLLPRNTPWRVADWIDLWRNFKPPFGEQARVNLVDLTIPVPIVDVDVVSARIDLIIRSYIEWIMKAKIEKTNITWDDLNITFSNKNWKTYNFNWVFSENSDTHISILWDVWTAWIKIKDFDYRPRLTFSIAARPLLEAWIPGRWYESWSFGTYDIYSFRIDPGFWLTRHRWTSWTINIDDIYIFRLNPEISAAKQQDNERRARNARLQESWVLGSWLNYSDLRDIDMNGQYNYIYSGSSSSIRSTRQDGLGDWRLIDPLQNWSSSSSSSSFRDNYSLRQNENNYLLSWYNSKSLSGVVLSWSKVSSKDTYVEDKLKEANDWFLEVYNDYLSTIENAINTFTQGMNSANDKMEKNKYQRAIDRVKEVKEIFLNRYKFIINYSKWIFTPQIVYVSESQLRDQTRDQFWTTPIDVELWQNRNNSSNQWVPNRVRYNDIEYMSTKMPSCDKNDVKIWGLTWAWCDSQPSSILWFSSFSYYTQSNALSSWCPTWYRLPSVSEVQTMLSRDITPADREVYWISEELYKKNKLLWYKEVLWLSIWWYLYEYDIPGWEDMSQYEKDMATLMRLDLKIINWKVYKKAMFGSKYWTSDIGYVFNLDFISSLPFSEHGQNEIMGNVRCVRN